MRILHSTFYNALACFFTYYMLEHGIHAGGEREVEDADAMMHEMYYESATHVARKRVNQHD